MKNHLCLTNACVFVCLFAYLFNPINGQDEEPYFYIMHNSTGKSWKLIFTDPNNTFAEAIKNSTKILINYSHHQKIRTSNSGNSQKVDDYFLTSSIQFNTFCPNNSQNFNEGDLVLGTVDDSSVKLYFIKDN